MCDMLKTHLIAFQTSLIACEKYFEQGEQIMIDINPANINHVRSQGAAGVVKKVCKKRMSVPYWLTRPF